jgi:hypothetical protein
MKLTLSAVSLIIIIFLISSVITYSIDVKNEYIRLKQDSHTFADIASRALVTSIWNYDEAGRDAICNSILSEKEVYSIRIFDIESKKEYFSLKKRGQEI